MQRARSLSFPSSLSWVLGLAPVFGLIWACGANTATTGSGNDAGATIGDDGGSQPIVAGTGTLPCDVATVLAGKCNNCHGAEPSQGAPMSLVTYADLTGPARGDKTVHEYDRVEQRIHSADSPMPPPPNPLLSATDMATLDGWIAAGAPSGAACDGGNPVNEQDSAPPPLTCKTDSDFVPATPWTMPTNTDDEYVCFGFDAPAGSIPAGTTRHVLGITPKIDNNTIVHHVVLYQADQSFTSTPTPCDPAGSLQWRIVYGWAPGGGAMTTPDGVGFPYDSTTHWVVQVHYNNLNHLAGQTDSSGFSLCTTDQPVAHDADVMAFGTMKIDIQPHQALDVTCTVQIPSILGSEFHAFATFPHMHKLGKTLVTSALPQDGGAPVSLGGTTSFNFNGQVWSPMIADIHAGDTLSTRCAWNNDTDLEVKFGPNTGDEMCYQYTAYYPKINLQQWSWAAPAAGSACNPTP